VESVRIKKGDMYTVTKESRATPQPVHHTDHRLVKKKKKKLKRLFIPPHTAGA